MTQPKEGLRLSGPRDQITVVDADTGEDKFVQLIGIGIDASHNLGAQAPDGSGLHYFPDIRVVAYSTSEGYKFLSTSIRTTPIKVAFIGDSTTTTIRQGSTEMGNLSPGIDISYPVSGSTFITSNAKYTDIFNKYHFINITKTFGAGGATLVSILARDLATPGVATTGNLGRASITDLIADPPDIIFFRCGINDLIANISTGNSTSTNEANYATILSNMKLVINRLNTVGSYLYVLGISGYGFNPPASTFIALVQTYVVRLLADVEEYCAGLYKNCLFVSPINRICDDSGAFLSADYSRDGVHPTLKGAEQIPLQDIITAHFGLSPHITYKGENYVTLPLFLTTSSGGGGLIPTGCIVQVSGGATATNSAVVYKDGKNWAYTEYTEGSSGDSSLNYYLPSPKTELAVVSTDILGAEIDYEFESDTEIPDGTSISLTLRIAKTGAGQLSISGQETTISATSKSGHLVVPKFKCNIDDADVASIQFLLNIYTDNASRVTGRVSKLWFSNPRVVKNPVT